MRITKMKRMIQSKLAASAAIAIAAMTLPMAGECYAESAYIAQVPVTVTTTLTFGNGMTQQQPDQYRPSSHYVPANVAGLPEASAAVRGNNLSQTMEIGSRNSVYHLQSGGNNISTAGVIGNYGNVNVLQSGNNLRSNVLLLNGAGLNVSVLQPAGSAPVNVLIARLPNGALLIKR